MATLLDFSASIGSAAFGVPGAVISTKEEEPSYIGSIGLLIGEAVNLRVSLQGGIGVAATLAPATVTFYIIRNNPDPTVPSGGVPVYTLYYSLDTNTPKIIPIHTADINPDLNPVTPGQINYSLFAVNKSGGTVLRTGPENFTGMVMTNF